MRRTVGLQWSRHFLTTARLVEDPCLRSSMWYLKSRDQTGQNQNTGSQRCFITNYKATPVQFCILECPRTCCPIHARSQYLDMSERPHQSSAAKATTHSKMRDANKLVVLSTSASNKDIVIISIEFLSNDKIVFDRVNCTLVKNILSVCRNV